MKHTVKQLYDYIGSAEYIDHQEHTEQLYRESEQRLGIGSAPSKNETEENVTMNTEQKDLHTQTCTLDDGTSIVIAVAPVGATAIKPHRFANVENYNEPHRHRVHPTHHEHGVGNVFFTHTHARPIECRPQYMEHDYNNQSHRHIGCGFNVPIEIEVASLPSKSESKQLNPFPAKPITPPPAHYFARELPSDDEPIPDSWVCLNCQRGCDDDIFYTRHENCDIYMRAYGISNVEGDVFADGRSEFTKS